MIFCCVATRSSAFRFRLKAARHLPEQTFCRPVNGFWQMVQVLSQMPVESVRAPCGETVDGGIGRAKDYLANALLRPIHRSVKSMRLLQDCEVASRDLSLNVIGLPHWILSHGRERQDHSVWHGHPCTDRGGSARGGGP